MKDLVRFFILPLIITATLFCVPYYKTRGAPAYDGNTVIGWPMTAYSFGGGLCVFAVESGSRRVDTRGGCPPDFFLENALIDAAFVFGAPLATYLAAVLWRRGKRTQKP